MTDLSNNPAVCARCGWGENRNSRTLNSATRTITYTCVWGSIAVQFVQNGDALTMNMTDVNCAGSGLVLNGAAIYPCVLNFPHLPKGFVGPGCAQLTYETTGPGVTIADFGPGEVDAADADAAKPFYAGFLPVGTGYCLYPVG